MTRTLFVFLRHAESVANAGGWLSGWEDVPLTPRGEAQAEAARALVATWPVRRCLVSDLGRARHTARLAMPHPMPVHVLPDLRERNMGQMQGIRTAEAREDGRMERWILPWHAAPPGGESHAESVGRAVAALRPWADGTPTLVVAHGSLLRDLIGLLDGLDPAGLGYAKPAAHAEPQAREWDGQPPKSGQP